MVTFRLYFGQLQRDTCYLKFESICISEDACSESFVQPYMKTTECNGVLMCRLCGYRGSRPHVMRHVRRKHLNIKPFACNLCDAMMTTIDDQQDHYRRRHKMSLSRRELVALHSPRV